MLRCHNAINIKKNTSYILGSIVGPTKTHPTVDGRNPAPVEVGSLSHYLQGSFHPRWVVWDFLHQQYLQQV